MRIRWSETASGEFQKHIAHIFEENPHAAANAAELIMGSIEKLKAYPALGRPGRIPMSREMILLSGRYIVAYFASESDIYILRIIHTSQSWPDEL